MRRLEPTAWNTCKVFLMIGSTGFAGGIGAQMHALLVRRHAWLTEVEFLEGMTLVNLLPGPTMSNLASYYGMKLAGTPGAILAVIGLCAPGFCLVSLLAYAYFWLHILENPVLLAILGGISAAAVGLTASMVLRTARASLNVPFGVWIALAAFIGVGVLRLNLLWVLLALFPISLALNRPHRQSPSSQGGTAP
jgi:chromate transporter